LDPPLRLLLLSIIFHSLKHDGKVFPAHKTTHQNHSIHSTLQLFAASQSTSVRKSKYCIYITPRRSNCIITLTTAMSRIYPRTPLLLWVVGVKSPFLQSYFRFPSPTMVLPYDGQATVLNHGTCSAGLCGPPAWKPYCN
jgi:hypothetical protein